MRRVRVLGYATVDTQARRLAILRDLWAAELSCVLIGERLGIHAATVSHLARRAGLPPRHRAKEER